MPAISALTERASNAVSPSHADSSRSVPVSMVAVPRLPATNTAARRPSALPVRVRDAPRPRLDAASGTGSSEPSIATVMVMRALSTGNRRSDSPKARKRSSATGTARGGASRSEDARRS